MLLVLVLLGIQLRYYVSIYGRLPAFRNRTGGGQQSPAVSVVVVVQDNIEYLANTLPLLLGQDYDDFEVVVVDLKSDEESAGLLQMMEHQWQGRLVVTKIAQDDRFPISNKMALNVGIKAARFENIIITTTEAYPANDKWLRLMARGFASGQVVLGYCGVEAAPGTKLMRCSRLMAAANCLSAAVRRKPYRGFIQNMGFTKSLYFSVKGFNHLNMNIGEDDLFVQSIARGGNTAVVVSPNATLRQRAWGGLGWWFGWCKFYGSTRRFYPRRARRFVACELVSRALFFVAVVVVAVSLPLEIGFGAVGLLLLRLAVVEFEMWRICRRLGERGLMWSYVVYDFVSPVTAALLGISRRVNPNRNIWR